MAGNASIGDVNLYNILQNRFMELTEPGIQEKSYLQSLGSAQGREAGTTPRTQTPQRLSQGDLELQRLDTQQFTKDDPLYGQPYPGSLRALSDSTKHKELFPGRFPDASALERGEQNQSLAQLELDRSYRSGEKVVGENTTPWETAYLTNKYKLKTPTIKTPYEEPIGSAVERISGKWTKNLKMLEGKKKGIGAPPGMTADGEAMFVKLFGGDSGVELPPIGKAALMRENKAYADTTEALSTSPVLTNPALRKQFDINSYHDYYGLRTELEDVRDEYNTVLRSEGKEAADMRVKELTGLDVDIDWVNEAYGLFLPARGTNEPVE